MPNSSDDTLRTNLDDVRQRIHAAARKSGRSGDDVRLIAVTKSVPVKVIQSLHAMGVGEFGENRLHVAQPKIEAFQGDARWHMVGHIQRRKSREVAALFHAVDSIDRLRLAETLERHCAELDRPLDALVEVNVSGEDAKFGVAPAELEAVLGALADMPHLVVRGLMTMAPWFDDPEKTRPTFADLRELAARHGLPELSMGMSNDYEVAVEEGATQVRIGTRLFKGMESIDDQ